MNKILGITLIVMALGIAIVPAFTDCQSQGKAIVLSSGKTVPMKCHWTGIAEIATGVPLAAVGIMMTFTRRKNSLYTLSGMGGILGIFAVLLPTTLIGVCTNMTALCNTVMQPTLTAMGSVAIAGSLGAMVLARKASS